MSYVRPGGGGFVRSQLVTLPGTNPDSWGRAEFSGWLRLASALLCSHWLCCLVQGPVRRSLSCKYSKNLGDEVVYHSVLGVFHHIDSCFRPGSASFDFLFSDSDVFIHFPEGGCVTSSLFRSHASESKHVNIQKD